jgi:acetyl-CoA acyltransferase
LVVSEKKLKELNLKPIARLVSYAVAGVPPRIMGIGPIYAIPKALEMAGLKKEDIDLFELNEAFACQSLAVISELKIPQEKVNLDGGALAIGHPLGASGLRISGKAASLLQRTGKNRAIATMCIGGGMGISIALERF